MPQVSFATPSLCVTFPRLLSRFLPSLPPTVRDMDVPPLFQNRFILTGYRPTGQPWRCYALSLFQKHNETLNVWSHLLAAVCMALRFTVFTILQEGGVLGFQLQGPEGQGISLDVSSLPLVFYVFAAITYLCCSAAAHLLQSHSEQVRYLLYLLDSVGVAIYQCGCALVLYLYSANNAWTQSMLGQIFLPATTIFAWFSCTASCYAKLHVRQLYPLQVILMAATYLLDISPVVHRLATYSWRRSPALLLHLLQVMLLLLSAFFFSCPVPERFAPGRFDIIGHSHQLSHILLSLCMLAQQEALLHDFLWRRPGLVRAFGEERLLLASASFPCVVLCCAATALAMRRRGQAHLMKNKDTEGGR
ncbi:membrane progestin receptor beta-like [Melanotaenia boesemani]|uniref:membrane progestin receptor beta-like n=1 Tax=Melanotaenia boesemani TaxID=1250792 RepID=UPI001C04538F|nr:membrane progestin receptor beta-like [Melanotaenia boesemani]